jgi:hypothetical protein
VFGDPAGLRSEGWSLTHHEFAGSESTRIQFKNGCRSWRGLLARRQSDCGWQALASSYTSPLLVLNGGDDVRCRDGRDFIEGPAGMLSWPH